MTLYPPNLLKRRLRAGQTSLGFWLSLNSLAGTEVAAGAGWDWLLLDMEHVPHNLERVEQHLLAAHHGGPAELVVRVPSVDPVVVKQLMDAGVRSFMFPYVQTVAEAELAVQATRYPPRGLRGYSGGTRATHYGRDSGYLGSHEDDVLVILQIESPQAVDNIAAFGRIAEVDAMLIGANDLAANAGHLGDTRHPDVVALFDRAAEAIMATGKAAGFQFFDDRMTALIARGMTLAAVAGDLDTLGRGMAAKLASLGR